MNFNPTNIMLTFRQDANWLMSFSLLYWLYILKNSGWLEIIICAMASTIMSVVTPDISIWFHAFAFPVIHLYQTYLEYSPEDLPELEKIFEEPPELEKTSDIQECINLIDAMTDARTIDENYLKRLYAKYQSHINECNELRSRIEREVLLWRMENNNYDYKIEWLA